MVLMSNKIAPSSSPFHKGTFLDINSLIKGISFIFEIETTVAEYERGITVPVPSL